jgi:hypothetical protein
MLVSLGTAALTNAAPAVAHGAGTTEVTGTTAVTGTAVTGTEVTGTEGGGATEVTGTTAVTGAEVTGTKGGGGEAAVLARFDGGAVTVRDLAGTVGREPVAAGGPAGARRSALCRREIEGLALEHYLAARFDPRDEPRFAAWSQILTWDAEAGALERALTAAAEPSVEQVEAALAGSPLAQPVPRRWRLQSLFLRVEPSAPADERAAVLARMAELRQRIVEGADFSALARQYSDSSSRHHGGKIGAVRLEELAPPVAAAVATLAPGQLTPPIEIDDGVTFVKLLEILPAAPPDLELARRRIRGRLQREALERQREALDARLLTEAGLDRSLPAPPATPHLAASSGLASYRVGGQVRVLRSDELQAYLQYRRILQPLAELPPEQIQSYVDERVLLELRAAEARRRGLASAPALHAAVERQLVTLRSGSALAARVERLVQEPAAAAVEAYYASHAEQLRPAEAVRLRALEAPLDGSLPASFYQRMRQLGERAHAGTVTFEQAAAALAPGAEVRELGWLSEDQLWLLGAASFEALRPLAAGQMTPLVQERRRLQILQVIEQRRAAVPPLAEARGRIAAILRNEQRARLRRTLRAELIEQAQIRLTAEGEARCGLGES